ncbi:PulJ/GspJ family protein [Prosthecomicrobium sp. N25]|uniref:PulJ/GspJ family protein n=1 Tax=Prosthecomicrobium sp. N25 TaxID=3129254 RepID=UPI0030780044
MRPPSSFRPAEALRRRGRGRTAGFSLVEVIAALVLTVALVAALMPFAGTVAARWMTGQRKIEDADLWMRATARLGDDLARAVPVMTGDEKTPRLVFRAGSREVVFVRPALSAAAGAALEAVALTVEAADDGEALVRRSVPYEPGAADRDPREFAGATTIASGPYRFSFASVSAKGERRDDWTDPKAMPRLLELTVAPASGRAAPPVPIALPVLAAAPRAAQPAQPAAPGQKPAESGGAEKVPLR